MFSAEDYLDSFFDESPFSVFGPDFLCQAALYNACATRDFSLAERLLLLYGRHPQATQQMKLKFERDVTLAKKEFPGADFFLVLPNNGKQKERRILKDLSIGYTETLREEASFEEAREDEVWVKYGDVRVSLLSYDPRMGRAIIWYASKENMLVGLVQSHLPGRPVYGGYVDMTPRVRVLNNNPAERWKWELFIVPVESLAGAKPTVRHIESLSKLLKSIEIKEDALMPPAHFWEIIVEQVREGKL